MTKEEKEELEFLRYFYKEVEGALGPASDDIYFMIADAYKGKVPKAYTRKED